MIYWRLAAAIAFAAFAAIVCIASLVAPLTAQVRARRISERAPEARAAELFALRVLPLLAGLSFAFGIVLPTFLWFEPSNTHEPLAKTLAIMGAIGVLWLARGGWQLVLACRATGRLAREWRVRGRRLEIPDVPIRVFAIDEPYPLVAVVGFRRPALFISDRVRRACSPDEVRAMILHECAHVTARDNIKRLLLRACPTLVAANRRLETLWASASEEAADAAATRFVPSLRMDLAHALITVARLATVTHPALPASALYLGGSIESRVRRLLGPAEPQSSSRAHIPAASLAVLIVTIAAALAFARPLHDVIEAVIAAVP